jgi:hypothetical protein
MDAVEGTDRRQYCAPPNVRVQVVQLDPLQGWVEKFEDTSTKNKHAVHQKGNSDKEPDGKGSATFHEYLTRK